MSRGPVHAGHIAPLDGLRAFAVLAVIPTHVRDPALWQDDAVGRFVGHLFSAGWVGVDLFFVLSGFLITRGLIGARGGREALRNFIARRFLRIVPLYFVVLLGWSMMLRWVDPTEAAACAEVLPWHATYLTNAWISANSSWPGCATGHFWSLSVEEQFYLLWPLVALNVGPRALVRICIAGIAGAVVLRIVLLLVGFSGTALYVLPFTRMDSLLSGALLAALLVTEAREEVFRRYARIWTRIFVLAVPALLLTAVIVGEPLRWNGANAWMVTLGFTTMALAFGMAVAWLILRPEGRAGRFLSGRGLRFLGLTSYAVYLVHPLVHELLLRTGGQVLARLPVLPRQAIVYFLVLALSVGIATCTRRWIEGPLLSLKRHFPLGPTPAPSVSIPSAALFVEADEGLVDSNRKAVGEGVDRLTY